jgi:hypothetical protein
VSTRFASCSCGQLTATVYYELKDMDAFIGIPVGVFADPGFPAPTVSVYEERMHGWVHPPEGAERIP